MYNKPYLWIKIKSCYENTKQLVFLLQSLIKNNNLSINDNEHEKLRLAACVKKKILKRILFLLDMLIVH